MFFLFCLFLTFFFVSSFLNLFFFISSLCFFKFVRCTVPPKIVRVCRHRCTVPPKIVRVCRHRWTVPPKIVRVCRHRCTVSLKIEWNQHQAHHQATTESSLPPVFGCRQKSTSTLWSWQMIVNRREQLILQAGGIPLQQPKQEQE